MTTQDPDELTETGAETEDVDARSNVTSEREVPPTHGGPGTNWTAVVIAVIAVLALVVVGYLVMVA